MKRPDNSREYFLPDLCNGQAVLWLVLGAALLSLVLALARGGLLAFDWNDFALILLLVAWSTLLVATLLCRLRTRLARLSLATGALVCLAVAGLATALVSLIGHWLVSGAVTGLSWHPPWVLVAGHGLIAVLLAGMLLRYFYLTHQLRRREQAALAAQVEALTARIRPHFLFNSLNSIASLVAEDAVAAEQAVEDLAALFRASLADASLVTVAEERTLCERYLRVEQLRFGERLAVDWQLHLPDDTPLPALALQPLVENAIYHGIQRLPQGGCVEIGGEVREHRVDIWVRNPTPPAAVQNHCGQRIATDNIRRRLQALFGSDAELSLTGQETIFEARLSYRPRQGEVG